MKTMNGKKGIQGFRIIEDECIWMKAGIVALHTCNRAYDCFDCKFDKAMTKAMGEKAAMSGSSWSAYFKKNYDGASRPCRHVLTGRINQPKICTHNYECGNCAFDQMLDDIEISQAQSMPEYVNVSGFDLAQEYYYHDGHTWVRIEHGGMARIGFDAFVMKLFGKAEFLPEAMDIGKHMEKGEPGWAIAQDNHRANVLSPISGTVLSVNQRARGNPGLMHDDPYQEGWLFIVEPEAPLKDLRKLKFGDAGIRWMEKENLKLMKMMGPEYARLAATGGEPVSDFYGFNPEIGWDNLVHTFLKS
jgi:glycine cleavage system H lipoate-binding protein